MDCCFLCIVLSLPLSFCIHTSTRSHSAHGNHSFISFIHFYRYPNSHMRNSTFTVSLDDCLPVSSARGFHRQFSRQAKKDRGRRKHTYKGRPYGTQRRYATFMNSFSMYSSSSIFILPTVSSSLVMAVP